jgi:anti-anti-sigma factor
VLDDQQGAVAVHDVPEQGRILVASQSGVYLMKFVGDVRVTLCTAVDAFLDTMFHDDEFRSVVIDLSRTAGVDSTSLGVLAKLSIQAKRRFDYVPTLVSTNPDITRVLMTMGFDEVFNIVDQPIEHEEQLGELPMRESTEEDIRQQVLEAHRALMSLNESNREAFHDLVETLEAAAP